MLDICLRSKGLGISDQDEDTLRPAVCYVVLTDNVFERSLKRGAFFAQATYIRVVSERVFNRCCPRRHLRKALETLLRMIRLELRRYIHKNERKLQAFSLVNRHHVKTIARWLCEYLFIDLDVTFGKRRQHVSDCSFDRSTINIR